MFDDLDDFDWKDGVIIGGLGNLMVEEEDEGSGIDILEK